MPSKINFEATDYTEIIHWNTCLLYPPPMLREVWDDDIKSIIKSDTKPIRDIKKFPCHTQAVERCVKLATEASTKVYEHEARDGYIRSMLLSRSVMPDLSKKSDFKLVHIEKKQ